MSSTCVESGDEVVLLDPLAPPNDAVEVWARIDSRPPTVVVVLKPDHVRDVDLFVRRYGARAFGPSLFWRDDIPETHLEPIEPGSDLPGGLVALYDGRGPQRDAAVATGAARFGFRGRVDGARPRASGVVDAVARGAGAPCAADAARPPIRVRARVTRRAGAQSSGVRASARASAMGRGVASRNIPARSGTRRSDPASIREASPRGSGLVPV